MKKVYLTLLLFIPMYVFSQQIISDRKDVEDLKEEVSMYTKVVVEVAGFKLNVMVATSAGGLWHFYDAESGKAKKFNTDLDVFNYMYDNGWEYVAEHVTSSSAPSMKYLFKKRE